MTFTPPALNAKTVEAELNSDPTVAAFVKKHDITLKVVQGILADIPYNDKEPDRLRNGVEVTFTFADSNRASSLFAAYPKHGMAGPSCLSFSFLPGKDPVEGMRDIVERLESPEICGKIEAQNLEKSFRDSLNYLEKVNVPPTIMMDVIDLAKKAKRINGRTPEAGGFGR